VQEVAPIVEFLRSRSWGTALRHYSSIASAGSPMIRKPGVVRADERDAVFFAMVTDRANREVSMASESLTRATAEYAELSLSHPGVSERHSVIRGLKPAREPVLDAEWVEGAIGIFDYLAAHSAVVVAMEHLSTLSETTGAGMRSQGVLHHPWPDQFERMGMVPASQAHQPGSGFSAHPGFSPVSHRLRLLTQPRAYPQWHPAPSRCPRARGCRTPPGR
jgi:hypothetical protein